MNTYRPTVRYDEKFRDYVESLFHKTRLDRNQIIRLALYVLGHSEEGNRILESFASGDTPLPSPPWELFDDWKLWAGDLIIEGEKRDVMDKLVGLKHGRKIEKKFTNKGGIKIVIK
jgi:hypothetical protein